MTVFSGASGVCSAWGWGPLRHCSCPHDPRITPVPLAFSGFSVALYIYAAPLALVLAFTLALSALRSVIFFAMGCCCSCYVPVCAPRPDIYLAVLVSVLAPLSTPPFDSVFYDNEPSASLCVRSSYL